jgi:hypothetical protein
LLRVAVTAFGPLCGCLPMKSGPTPEVGQRFLRTARAGGACAIESDATRAQGVQVKPESIGGADVAIEVRTDRVIGAISPFIYGTNGDQDIAATRQTVVRSGGNRLTAYNWENNASNAGADWHFQNDGLMAESDQPGAAVLPMIRTARKHGAAAIVTIPIVDWVSADKRGGGDVRRSGPDYLTKRFRQNRARKGAPFVLPPTANDEFVYQDEFVHFLRQEVPDATVLFSLDNEPDLWSHTHAEVHPEPVTYAELVRRNTDYARAVKDVWSEAEVLGFVSYGWTGFVDLQGAPDGRGRDFVDYYLRSMKAAEASAGRRLIDYLDLHWYPEARGGGERIVLSGSSESPEFLEARLEAPRSLWDDTYRERSYIADNVGAIRLVPRMHEKIQRHYPGTKLAFTEWSYGGGDDITGALATADVLGIFGCRGVALANIWPTSRTEAYSLAALRAYRNYDGKGGSFGDTAVYARSSNHVATSVYASTERSDPGRVVVVLVNKVPVAQQASVSVTGPISYTSLTRYHLEASSARTRPGPTIPPAARNAFAVELPAFSVTVLELRQ